MKKPIDLLEENRLYLGRMISGSKSYYLEKRPNNKVVFNANIFDKDGKIWYGDLDLTISGPTLQKVVDECKETLYVLREMDGRFKNEKISLKEVREVAVATFSPML